MKIPLLTTLLFLPVLVSSQIKVPKSYTRLEVSPSNGKKIEPLSFLFDGDQIQDHMMLVVTENDFPRYKLLIYLSGLKKQFEVDLISSNDFQLYPTGLKMNKKTISYGYYEDGTSAFGRVIKLRYDNEAKNIQVIGYDAGYKSSPTEQIDKSYNLLTGVYTVKRTKYGLNNSEKSENFTGKNTFFINKIFINNLSLETLKNLDDVGSKYE